MCMYELDRHPYECGDGGAAYGLDPLFLERTRDP